MESSKEQSVDRLSRGAFARFLADKILETPPQGAGVFALCGGWGSGKSWMAQRIVEAVGERARIVSFEPWMLSGTDALVRQFLSALARAIKKQEPSDNRKEALKRFYAYASVLAAAGGVVALAGVDAKVGGAVATASVFSRLKGVFDAAKEAWKTRTENTDLQVARDRVSEALMKLKEPMLVVIDDIERLDSEEVRTLFRLIKACADFPNVRYLLLYDRDYVAAALGAGVRDGEAFLDKIVHGTYDLPEMTYEQRVDYLDKEIDKILPSRPLGDAFDRLVRAFDALLLPGLTTLRLIDRYSMTAQNLASTITYEGKLEIDSADFLILEYLRQREPKIYTVLREWSAPRAGGRVRTLAFGDDVEKARAQRLEEAKPDDPERKQLADEAIRLLSESSAISGSGDLFNALERDHVARRFKSKEWRPVFFGFEAGRATLSSAEFDALRKALPDRMAAVEWMGRFDDHERRGRVAKVLSLRFAELDVAELTSFLEALIVWGEERPYDQPPGALGWSSWTDFLGELGLAVLEQISMRGDAIEAWVQVLAKTGAVLGPASILAREKMERTRGRDEVRWLSDEDFATLEREVLTTVRRVMVSDEVWQKNNPSGFYSAFYELSESEAMRWYEGIKDSEVRMIGWINKWLPNYLQSNGQTNLSPPKDEAFTEAIRSTPEDSLTPEGSRARKAYLESINARRRFR